MSKQLIPKARYEEDLSRGYTVLKWNPGGSQTVRDNFTGQMVTTQRAAVDFYQCMRCQFSSTEKKLIDAHLEKGYHFWPYRSGDTPYGPVFRVEIEGLTVAETKTNEEKSNGDSC